MGESLKPGPQNESEPEPEEDKDDWDAMVKRAYDLQNAFRDGTRIKYREDGTPVLPDEEDYDSLPDENPLFSED